MIKLLATVASSWSASDQFQVELNYSGSSWNRVHSGNGRTNNNNKVGPSHNYTPPRVASGVPSGESVICSVS